VLSELGRQLTAQGTSKLQRVVLAYLVRFIAERSAPWALSIEWMRRRYTRNEFDLSDARPVSDKAETLFRK